MGNVINLLGMDSDFIYAQNVSDKCGIKYIDGKRCLQLKENDRFTLINNMTFIYKNEMFEEAKCVNGEWVETGIKHSTEDLKKIINEFEKENK